MAIRQQIIHRIERQQVDQPANITLADSGLPPGADTESLLAQLKKRFNAKPGKHYGAFEESITEFPFSRWLEDVLDERLDFNVTSSRWAERFAERLSGGDAELDGFFYFILEDRADGPVYWIFFLETVAGMTINPNLAPDTVEFLPDNRLDLALRIELDDWRGSTAEAEASPLSNYLTLLISRSYSKPGEAFTKTIGFRSTIDTKRHTETFLEAIADFSSAAEDQKAVACRQRAVEYCSEQQQLGEGVTIDELSRVMDEENPDAFAGYFRDHQSSGDNGTQTDTEQPFFPDPRKLKQLVRFSGKGKGLSLSFSSDLIQQSVIYDESSDTLIIKDLPKSLKTQLKRHLHTGQE